MIFYVYVYLDPRKPGNFVYGDYHFNYEPFYVGKGKNYRKFDHYLEALEKKINNPKINKIQKLIKEDLNPIIILYKTNMLEKDALNLEKDMISVIGCSRTFKGMPKKGPLTNRRTGGTGGSHFITKESIIKFKKSIKKYWTPEKRKEKSKALKGRVPWNKGIKMSKEYCEKMREITKNNMSNKNVREKISKALKGRVPWNKGKTLTDEHKRKCSEALKGKPAVTKGKHLPETWCKNIGLGRSKKYEKYYIFTSPEPENKNYTILRDTTNGQMEFIKFIKEHNISLRAISDIKFNGAIRQKCIKGEIDENKKWKIRPASADEVKSIEDAACGWSPCK